MISLYKGDQSLKIGMERFKSDAEPYALYITEKTYYVRTDSLWVEPSERDW
jgi:hypothetical protein